MSWPIRPSQKKQHDLHNEEGDEERKTLSIIARILGHYLQQTAQFPPAHPEHVENDWERCRRDARQRPLEGGVGEPSQKLLETPTSTPSCDCPPGIFYANGVKANVLFFDKKTGRQEPWTKDIWY